MIQRRNFIISGIASLFVAPAVVRSEILMPVSAKLIVPEPSSLNTLQIGKLVYVRLDAKQRAIAKAMGVTEIQYARALLQLRAESKGTI
jgi:hypothetical protein